MNTRTRQTDRTRNAIIEAALELLLGDSDPGSFTMQTVADEAGVSHRTLYRYFASRQELFNAVGSHMDGELESAGEYEQVPSFDAWVQSIDSLVAFGALHRDTLRKTVGLSAGTGVWRTDRDQDYWSMFRDRFPHLDESEAREDFAIFRFVCGATSSVMLSDRFSLPPEKIIPAIERAVAALVDAIAARDAAAETRSGS